MKLLITLSLFMGLCVPWGSTYLPSHLPWYLPWNLLETEAAAAEFTPFSQLDTFDDGTPFQAFPDYYQRDYGGFQYFGPHFEQHFEQHFGPHSWPPSWKEKQEGDIESNILRATSDAMEGSLTLKTVTDINFILHELKYDTSDHVTLNMRLEELTRGVVLLKSGGYDVLKLEGSNLSPETGGDVDLVYLSDGVWNSHKTFRMSLARNNQGWGLQTREPNAPEVRFNTMYLKKRMLFGKMTGIESITVSTTY